MLTSIYKNLLTTILLVTLSFTVSMAHAVVSLSGKYPHQGQITSVDKTKRLLTIETSIFKGDKTRHTLTIDKKVYKVDVGAKLKNMPKSQQYTGLKNLKEGTLVSFKLKRGTEKNKIPTITEIWVELQ